MRLLFWVGWCRPRIETAARLYHEGFATRLFTAGRGDAQVMKTRLLALDVAASRVTVEDLSANTFENAQRIAPLLREAKVQKVLLVTSRFHSRRAFNCFRRAAPEMEFRVVTPEAEPGKEKYENGLARTELWKLLFYLLRYGMIP